MCLADWLPVSSALTEPFLPRAPKEGKEPQAAEELEKVIVPPEGPRGESESDDASAADE